MPDGARSRNAGLARGIGEECSEDPSATTADTGEAGVRSEIDLTYMGGIERGKRNPSLLVMARLAEALSVPLTKLLSE